MSKTQTTPKRSTKRKTAGQAPARPKPGTLKKKTIAPARRARPAAKKATTIRARAIAGPCLDLIDADDVVQAAVPGGPCDIDISLEDAGLTTPSQRAVFRAAVVEAVGARGCSIDTGDVPNAANTLLREVRAAVQAKSRPRG